MLARSRKPSFIWQLLSYTYAGLLIGLSLVLLLGIGNFNFSGVGFTTPGCACVTIFLVILQLFALLSLLGVRTSTILRKISEVCLILAPGLIIANEIYLIVSQQAEYNTFVVFCYVTLFILGTVCFVNKRNWETE